MTENEFKEICLCGETTRVQFKREFTSQKEIAKNIIVLIKGESANRFRTIVWRTIPKGRKYYPKERRHYPKGTISYPKEGS